MAGFWLLAAVCFTLVGVLVGWPALRQRLSATSQLAVGGGVQAAASDAASGKARKGSGRGGNAAAAARVDVTRKQPTAASTQQAASSGLALLRQLKGHSDACTAVCYAPPLPPSARSLLAVASRDRLVRVWQWEDGAGGGSGVVSVKMRFDYATALCFGPGSGDSLCRLYCVMSATNAVDEYSVAAGDGGKLDVSFARSFDTACKETVTAARCTADRVLLLMSRGTDLPILAYAASSGALLRSVAVKQLRLHDLAVSSDGRLFAAATKLSDVKVWSVHPKTAAIEHILTLSKHSRAVQSVAFHRDSACTVTADGVLTAYNIAVRHADGEDAHVRWQHDTRIAGEPFALRAAADPTSPASWLLAVASSSEVRVYRATPTACTQIAVLSGVGGQWGLAALEMQHDGKQIVTLSNGDKTASLWTLTSA